MLKRIESKRFFFALNKLNGNTKLLRIIIAKKKNLHQLDIFDVLKKKEIIGQENTKKRYKHN